MHSSSSNYGCVISWVIKSRGQNIPLGDSNRGSHSQPPQHQSSKEQGSWPMVFPPLSSALSCWREGFPSGCTRGKRGWPSMRCLRNPKCSQSHPEGHHLKPGRLCRNQNLGGEALVATLPWSPQWMQERLVKPKSHSKASPTRLRNRSAFQGWAQGPACGSCQ